MQVRSDASQYKFQHVSDAHVLNRCIASLTLFADAPSKSGNRIPDTPGAPLVLKYVLFFNLASGYENMNGH